MTDITIPPEAEDAVAREIAPHPWSMYTDAAKDHFRHKARAACLAMLKAWPGMEHQTPDGWSNKPHIILPLPMENTNAEG